MPDPRVYSLWLNLNEANALKQLLEDWAWETVQQEELGKVYMKLNSVLNLKMK